MAFQVADRVKETSTTTGTGTLNLAGAEPGYQTFVAGVGTGNTTYYAIVNRATSEFEVGIGTVTDAAPDTLSRDTIISSSNSDLAVNFSAGTKDVICTLPSEKSYVLNDAGNTTISSNLSVTAISGSGAGLTNLNGSNVSSGTLASDRLPTVPTTKGGTGLTTIGSANQVLAVNGTGTALEYQTISADITGVTAGSGLTGGGTSGDVTLNVGAGTGVTVNADDIAIGQDVATSASPTFAGATFTANVSLGDSDYLRLGASNDLQIYHNGSNSFIDDAGTGNLYIRANGLLQLGKYTGETFIDCTADGAVDIKHNNLTKLETTASGATTTGTHVATTFSGSGASLTNIPNGALDNSQITINGTGVSLGGSINVGDITGVTAGSGLTGGGTTGAVTLNVGAGTGIDVAADSIAVDVSDFMTNGVNNRVLTATGADAMNAEANMTFDGSTLAVTGGATFTANVSLGDSDYLRLGASQDLLIYHDGSHSYIKDQGTGNLKVIAQEFVVNNSLDTQNMIYAVNGGAVNLYHAGNQKFETTSSGCTVTGTLVETSSIAYKENVKPLDFNDAIYSVNAVKYDRKDGSSKDEVGVIAEELYKVLPDLVECKDGKPEAVKYTKMTMYLLEALKKQNQEIQELKKRLN